MKEMPTRECRKDIPGSRGNKTRAVSRAKDEPSESSLSLSSDWTCSELLCDRCPENMNSSSTRGVCRRRWHLRTAGIISDPGVQQWTVPGKTSP